MPDQISCRCGCGRWTENEFAPGHALRHARELRDQAQSGNRAAFSELYARGWTIPQVRTSLAAFGVEAEFFGIDQNDSAMLLARNGINCQNDGYHHNTTDYWRVTEDGSVTNEGCELVSPILRVDASDFAETSKAVRLLREAGGRVNVSCGLHIHHNASHLNLEQIANITGHWVAFQPIISTMLPPSRRNASYARAMEDAPHWMAQIMDLGSKRALLDGTQYWGRYHSLNLSSLSVHNTFEFRQHSGTLNGTKIEHWARFTKLFMDLPIKGKDVNTLIGEYGSEAAIGAMGADAMFAYIGAPASMADFYRTRINQLGSPSTMEAEDAESEDDGSDGYGNDYYSNGERNDDDDATWCSSCSDWHPDDESEDY